MDEKIKWLNVIDKILFYGFFLTGAISLIFGLGTVLFYTVLISTFFASWGLGYLFDLKKINPKYKILINISLFLNLLGEFKLYYSYFSFDKVLHITIPLFITIMVYDYYSKKLKPQKDMIFFTVLGMTALFEVIEYLAFALFNLNLVGVLNTSGTYLLDPYNDTMWDLIAGMVGSLVFLLFKKERISEKVRSKIKKISKRRTNSIS